MMKKLTIAALLLLSLRALAVSPPALISHTALTNYSTGYTPAISGTGGNFIAICENGTVNGGSYPVAQQPQDSSGNTYTLLYEIPDYSVVGVSLWVAFNPTVTSSMTFNTSGYPGPAPIAVSIYSGVASPDQTNGAVSLSTGNITPTNINELIVACVANQISVAPTAATSPLTFLDGVYNSTTRDGAGSAYQIQTTPATTVGTTFTAPGGSPAALIASFYSDETPGTLSINSTSLPEGFVGYTYPSNGGTWGTPYTGQLTAVGGILPYTWSCPSTCNLPAGLSINSSTGLITGTTTSAVSAASVTLKVTDSASPTPNTATITLPMTVASTFLTVSNNTCTGSALIGTQYASSTACAVTSAGGTGTLTYSLYSSYYADTTLPEGLTLNPSTGAIPSATIYGQGGYNAAVVVTDSLGSWNSVFQVWEIAGKNMNSGCLPMAGSIFSTRVDSLPVDTSPAAPMSSAYASHAVLIDGGAQPTSGGIPFLIVPYNQPSNNTVLYWSNNGADPSSFPPYSIFSPSTPVTEGSPSMAGTAPVPFYAPIEDTAFGVGQDQHVPVIVEAGGGNPCQEFDMWQASVLGGGSPYWNSHANLWLPNTGTTGSNPLAMNFAGNGQTDAAGLPLAPLITNAEEVNGTGTPTSPNGAVLHPTRFTLPAGGMLGAHVWPAAGDPDEYGSCNHEYVNRLLVQPNAGPNQPPTSCTQTTPYGEIYRLKASVYSSLPSCFATSPQAYIIATGFAHYGIINADNGQPAVVLTPDSQWNNTDIACLSQLTFSNFEPVNVMGIVKDLDGSGLPTLTYAVTGGVSPTAGVQISGAVKFSGGVVLQ
jgi:hypothetical protein